ncbi:BCL2 associated agonist of cell death b [Mastacembelus armatus]|uniref:BCL2 associated agonist of cell death b n=1 Tax=Mastacembelus armatus TaxID=205130 RepID=A0A3Q3RXS8_9TELE|nr:bcl2-associated agonist of cell death [Mastacembelus armatus]
MAAKFSISESESDSSEEVEGGKQKKSSARQEQQVSQRHALALPELRTTASNRIRLSSESQSRVDEEAGTPTDGAPFRGRSKSAPPALWAAKKYGQQLRRMSDEFDSLLDKGEMRVRNAGKAQKMHHSKTWWSYLFSYQETDGENNLHENHTPRTE